MFGRCSAIALLTALSLGGCKRNASAEDARVCVQAYVVRTWARCQATDVRCDVSEMEILSRNDRPGRSELVAEAPVHFRPVSGTATVLTARFRAVLTPAADGTFVCGEVAAVAER